jgi:hypothetical protein
MNIYRVLCCCAAVALPQLTWADLPFSNDVFGKIEGVMTYCAKVNPQAAGQYQAQAKALVQGVPAKVVLEARETPEYKEAYDAAGTEIGNAPKDQAVQVCNGFLVSK